MKDDKIKGAIITWERFEGRKNIGSSRIRGHWLVKYWDEVEHFIQGQKYEFVIYQKCYWVEHAKAFKGIKIFDLCDPDFLHFGYRTKEMLEEVDGITTSTEELAKTLRAFTNKPVLCIPDRVDLDSHKQKKNHQGIAKNAVWFGYSTGFDLLKPVIRHLEKHNLGLIVIADRGFLMPSSSTDKIALINYPWKLETVNDDIIRGDMVINVRSETGKWKYKSNNKTLTAWALGMPVATNVEELEKFLSEEERIKESGIRLEEVKEKWDIRQSIVEFQSFIEILKQKKS